MGRELLISVLLHAIVITVAITLMGTNIQRQHKPFVIYLTDEGPGKGGGTKSDVIIRRGSHEHASMASLDDYKNINGQMKTSGEASPREPFAKNVYRPEKIDSKETETQKSDQTLVASLSHHENELSSSSEGSNGDYGLDNRGVGYGIGTEGEDSGPGREHGRGTGGSGHGETNSLSPLDLQQHFAYIRELILKNLKYPPVARTMGWKGVVTISFVVLENGAAENIRVTKSSGHAALDRNVVRTIQKIQPFPKPPVKAELIIPITFRPE